MALVLSSTSSSSVALIAAHAAAVERKFPPKVDAWLPGPNEAATVSLASIAPMATPPASPLARVIISGSTP